MICTKCGVWKDDSSFAWKIKEKGTKNKVCRSCQSEYSKQHYRDNKKEYVDRASARKIRFSKKVQSFVWEYLNNHECVDCGESDPIVLEFDHVRGEKFKSISEMMGLQMSLGKIEEEISKCEVRCANCHKRRHAFDRGTWRTLMGD